MSFTDLGLSEKTIQAITDLGYQEPTTVQKDVIPSILAGKDVFTIAPAVCGKTCAYIFPLIDIISQKNGQTILVITADSKESINISDKFAVFNKYHEINDIKEKTEEDYAKEANVIIASPSLLLENIEDNNMDLSGVNILVVDDINLIKKNRQLTKFEKILELLPTNKQNIVFTTRRSKETQDILNKILKAPAEIKVEKNKESELNEVNQNEPSLPQQPITKEDKKTATKKHTAPRHNESKQDKKALDLAKRYKIFGRNVPSFLLEDTVLVAESDS